MATPYSMGCRAAKVSAGLRGRMLHLLPQDQGWLVSPEEDEGLRTTTEAFPAGKEGSTNVSKSSTNMLHRTQNYCIVFTCLSFRTL